MGSPTTSGSINEVGWRFQPFRINDLELVDQIFTSWNPLTSWFRQIDDIRAASRWRMALTDLRPYEPIGGRTRLTAEGV
jgi:hypothetical protein